MSGGPLADVRVLDLTSVVMGPFATQMLGDLGAEVITVEEVRGDTNRTMGLGPHPQFSGVALNLLRNKRNISLDLRHPDGREACLRLAEHSDILVTNLRPGSLRRLALDYEACDGWDITDRLHEVSVPTLVLTGDLDALTPPSRAEQLATGIPGAILVRIPATGHWPMKEAPRQVDRLIAGFLARLELADE